MARIILLLVSSWLFSCSSPQYDNPHAVIKTRFGEIELEVYPAKAPKTANTFLTNVEAGLYNSGSFYRVLKTEEMNSPVNTGIIQGGIWGTNGKHRNIPGIVHESTKQSGLSHTDGTISMARTDTGTATTEFFICIGDQSPLDYGRRGTPDGEGFAAFGKVFKGMDIVRKIQGQSSRGDKFDEQIEIIEIKKL